MDFAIREEASNWFKDIKGSFEPLPGANPAPEFDAFYFCFVAGIAMLRKPKNIPVGTMRPLVENFPGPYRARGKLLVALFLARELEYLGISLTDRDRVRTAIARLVRPEAPNDLSDDGVREFNKYAFGGYDVLFEWFDGDRPRSLETFLRVFKQRLDAAFLNER